jgi:hypothetical protein
MFLFEIIPFMVACAFATATVPAYIKGSKDSAKVGASDFVEIWSIPD